MRSFTSSKTNVKFSHSRWEEVLEGSAFKKLIEKLPDVAEIVLDQCVTYSPLPPSHEDFTVKFNMRYIDPYTYCYKYTDFPPAIMAKHKRERLLNHLVTQVLLRVKWMKLGKFLTIFNLVFFAVFVILYSIFILNARSRSTLLSGKKAEQLNQTSELGIATPIVLLVLLLSQFIKETIQLALMRLAYFLDLSNWMETVMFVLALIFILPFIFGENVKAVYSETVQWNSGIVALLLCYVNLTLAIRRFGELGLYVTMYIEVLWTFIKVITSFLITLIGYCLVFYVLLKGQVRTVLERSKVSIIDSFFRDSNRKLEQRRFWTTHVNGKSIYCILLPVVLPKISCGGNIVSMKINIISSSYLLAQRYFKRENASLPIDYRLCLISLIQLLHEVPNDYLSLFQHSWKISDIFCIAHLCLLPGAGAIPHDLF